MSHQHHACPLCSSCLVQNSACFVFSVIIIIIKRVFMNDSLNPPKPQKTFTAQVKKIETRKAVG